MLCILMLLFSAINQNAMSWNTTCSADIYVIFYDEKSSGWDKEHVVRFNSSTGVRVSSPASTDMCCIFSPTRMLVDGCCVCNVIQQEGSKKTTATYDAWPCGPPSPVIVVGCCWGAFVSLNIPSKALNISYDGRQRNMCVLWEVRTYHLYILLSLWQF